MSEDSDYAIAEQVKALRAQREEIGGSLRAQGADIERTEPLGSDDLFPWMGPLDDPFLRCQWLVQIIAIYYDMAVRAAEAGDTRQAKAYYQWVEALWNMYFEQCGPVVVVT